MKRLILAAIFAAALLVTPAAGLTKVEEKDEHVDCSGIIYFAHQGAR